MSTRAGICLAPLLLLAIAPTAGFAQGLQRGGTPETDRVPPVNSAPEASPYRAVRDWAELTIEQRPWGGTNNVAIDRDGKTVWATDRCTAPINPGCLGTQSNPIHHFDENGREIGGFGGGMFVWPHGLHVDRDGNIWVTDARLPTADELVQYPDARGKGSVVVKFSPDGKVLMTLGTPGVRGNPPAALSEPTAVITDPGNGDIYVAESHMDINAPDLVGRISVFDATGKFLRTIGKAGMGPGEFRTPHAMAFDSKGNLIVADRSNHRVQMLTKSGVFVREYANFSRVSGLAVGPNDVLFAADSESTEAIHPGWSRGVRIGSLSDGRVTTFIPPHQTNSPEGAMGEGIAIDPDGNLYMAESILLGVTKFVKEPSSTLAYSVLYVDADGETHFRDDRLDFVLPTSPQAADGDMFFHALPGAVGATMLRLKAGMFDAPHTSPQRMLIVGIQGESVMETSDGDRRVIGPGTVVLLEDTTGAGHSTSVPGDEDYFGLGILMGTGTR